VKEHYGVFGKLGTPKREVALDVIVEVAAVDVEQVDRSFVEVLECILECRTNEAKAEYFSLLRATTDWNTLSS
jgi:hypothetical protein